MRSETLKELLISLFVALLVWFYAKMSQTYEVVMRVPVVFVNVPEGKAFLERTDTVLLKLRGSGFEIAKLKVSSPVLLYDLSGMGNSGELPVDTSHLHPRARVSIQPLFTDRVRYRLDEEVSRTVSVIPTLKGHPARGHVLYGWKVEGNVEVRGPKSVVQHLDSLPTYPIDLTGRKRDFRTTVRVFTEGLGLTTVKPGSVVVHVMIDTVVSREVPVIMGDSSFTAEIVGPRRVVEEVRRLRAFLVGDSLVIPRPEGTRIILPTKDEKGDTLQQQGHKGG